MKEVFVSYLIFLMEAVIKMWKKISDFGEKFYRLDSTSKYVLNNRNVFCYD